MADGGTEPKREPKCEPVVRKPSRRSPTTGHRRKRTTDLKRSQSSPREPIVPTSSDDEGRNAPPQVRRKSLSPGPPGAEPKKVLRRRHRPKEKSQDSKDEAPTTSDDVTPKESSLKSQQTKIPVVSKDDKQPTSETKIGITKTSGTKKVILKKIGQPPREINGDPVDRPSEPSKNENKESEKQLTKVSDEPPKKTERRKSSDTKDKPKTDAVDSNDLVKQDEKQISDVLEESKVDAKTDKLSEDERKEEKATRPNSWWGGWTPFKRKEGKSEAGATGGDVSDARGEDCVTSDDETAAEFVKLLSGNKTEIRDVVVKNKLSVEDKKALLSGGKVENAKTWRQVVRESRVEFAKFKGEFPEEVERLRKLRNRCFCDILIMFIFCGCGALVFKTTEGTFESFYKCGVKRVKRDFIEDLWRSSHFMKEEDWKSKARAKLWSFENQLQEAFEAGVNTYSGQKSWSFINGIIYCLSIVTTIGYGHIAPVTNSGRALTIAYSIIGIPLFLILLADFGKLFTRGIKFLWAFVRRLYYTGSCKKVRRTGPVQEVMKGVQLMYDTIRRPSMFPQGAEPGQEGVGTPGDPPSTPALSAFAIDDEFNLPISVAISILLVYIFLGATVFWWWEEEWTFFESFYFVFISMSTIGFGDLVPKNQMYMMLSIVYLAFGLALTSMCINVVQEKLSDSFRKASAKIGATIGLKVSDDDGTISPVTPTHVELAEVHKSSIGSMATLHPQQQVS